MFCESCGKEIKDTAVYCKFCGAKVIESELDRLDKDLEERGMEVDGNWVSLSNLIPSEQRGDYFFVNGVDKAQKGEYKEAINYFKKALEYDPKAVNSYDNIVLAYIKLKDYQNATLWLKKGLEHKPNNERLLYSLSEMYYLMSQYDEALKVMGMLLSLDPNNVTYQDTKRSIIDKM